MTDQPASTAPDNGPESDADEPRSRLRRPLMVGGLVVAIVVGVWVYLSGGRYVETDNAQLQAGKVMIAANVSGRVIAVEVQENQFVKAGQVLFRIEPSSYQASVDAAEAGLAGAVSDAGSTRADLAASEAEVRKAQSTVDFARTELARQRALAADGISSKADVDKAVLALRSADATVAEARAKAASYAARLVGGGNVGVPDARRAAASLRQARIALEDTVVRAPQDGIVTKVNQVQVGSYVAAGKPLFVLTGVKFWVEANFKENQLRYMRLGQSAKVTIDAFPGVELKGTIASFSPGTGNSFSVLPAENATGNWVKVTQRLPIIVALTEWPKDIPLHAGLSVEVTVDTGHQRRLFGPDVPPVAPLAGKAAGR